MGVMKLPFLGHGAWRVAGVLLPFLLWCGVAVATTVNSVTVTNHATNPSYVIASDAATGGNRHQIQASAQINCTEGTHGKPDPKSFPGRCCPVTEWSWCS